MAAMTLDLEIWVEGQEESQRVIADQRDMAEFELAYKVGTNTAMDTMTMVFFRYVAWAALKRTNPPGESFAPFNVWSKTAISVEPVEDDERDEANPTSPAV